MDAEPTLTSLDQQMPQAASPFEVGQVLDGKYEILALLGRGGMGAVYRVRHLLLNVELALKTLDTQRIGDASSSRRFQTEAKAAFSLQHPNLVKVHDFGVFEDGHPFLVMDLVQGRTLQTMLKERGKLNLDEIESIFTQLCFGLANAHEQQVVHRDIKPANIMIVDGLPLSAEGSVKVLDFGIAKIVNSDRGEMQTLTQTGEIFGSPYYMSPEQCSGDIVDQRSDVYSLGCVLFEALTGTPPLVGSNALRTMMLHVNEVAPTLKEAALGAEFPEGMESIVGKMLAKASSERFSNLGVVAHELSKVCSSVRKSESNESVLTETNKISSAAAKNKSLTFTLTRMQLLMIVVAIASVASVCTLCVDRYFYDKHQNIETVVPADGPLFDGLHKEYAATLRDIDSKTKLAFERLPKIVGTPVGSNRQKVVFPDESIGKLYYGQREESLAKGAVVLPIAPPLWLEVSSDSGLVLNNSFVFQKIDLDLFTGLIFKGITQNSALEFMEEPELVKAQVRGADELFVAAAKWRKIDRLKLIDAKLTPSIFASIEKMKLFELHLNRVVFDQHLLSGNQVFNRIKILIIERCESGPILKEVAHSSSINVLSIGDNVAAPDIDGLSNCKNLTTIAFSGDAPLPAVVFAAARLKQVSNLIFQSSVLSKTQLRDLSKDWNLVTPPANSGIIIQLKRRA